MGTDWRVCRRRPAYCGKTADGGDDGYWAASGCGMDGGSQVSNTDPLAGLECGEPWGEQNLPSAVDG